MEPRFINLLQTRKLMKRILLVCLVMGVNLSIAQDTTSTQRKNTIKLDLTSRFLYRNAVSLSYERVTKPNQTFAITLGYQEFPRASNLGSNIAVREDRSRNGYRFGGEYRFYLKKENKYLAPRGIYIGPYFTFHGFKNERLLEIDNNGTPEEALLVSKLSILNIGFQLGYQFVLNDRWTIDLVLVGPSVSKYHYGLNMKGDFTFDIDDIQNEIILDLIDRFPLLEEVLTDKEADRSGNLDTWSYGYRYQLMVGYHFGRKKK